MGGEEPVKVMFLQLPDFILQTFKQLPTDQLRMVFTMWADQY